MDESGSGRATGRILQGSGYGDDDGAPDAALVAALAHHAAQDAAAPGSPEAAEARGAALAALADARLLVPVVAVLGETEEVAGPDGRTLTSDKSSDMAVVLLTRADGERALLAFTGVATLSAWRADARPVPVATALAAATAVQEGAAALVVDVAGPHRLVVDAAELARLAAGFRVVRTHEGWAWIGSAIGGAPE